MIEDIKAVRITGIFHRHLTSTITAALDSAGVSDYRTAAGRWIVLREREGILGIRASAGIMDNPVDFITILVEPGLENGVLKRMIESGDLTTPGRGSVFSEDVVIYRAHDQCGPETSASVDSGPVRLQHELTGICCIVQRGEGNEVARVALDTGTCVPAMTYGHGTGVRDKLGLLRITIPAEKELITIMSSAYDAEAIMDLMITEGKLNQPGKGFIYLFPIRAGQVNMKVIQGMPRHAASVEQIVVAIDEMQGGTSWRAKGGTVGLSRLRRRHYLRNLVSLTFTCNEGWGENLVKEAMNAGMPGATMSKAKRFFGEGEVAGAKKVSPAREICNMVVDEGQVGAVVDAMEAHGALSDEAAGQFCVSSVPKAYTFISGQS